MCKTNIYKGKRKETSKISTHTRKKYYILRKETKLVSLFFFITPNERERRVWGTKQVMMWCIFLCVILNVNRLTDVVYLVFGGISFFWSVVKQAIWVCRLIVCDVFCFCFFFLLPYSIVDYPHYCRDEGTKKCVVTLAKSAIEQQQ